MFGFVWYLNLGRNSFVMSTVNTLVPICHFTLHLQACEHVAYVFVSVYVYVYVYALYKSGKCQKILGNSGKNTILEKHQVE